MIKEVWKDTPEYEGLYQASNFGEIKRYKNQYGKTVNRILKKCIDQGGYFYVNLSKNNNPKTFRIHTLILRTFIGFKPVDMECRHLDGNKLNNNCDNLKYGTYQENLIDKIKHGTVPSGQKHWKAKLKENDILIIRNLIQNKISISDIAKKYNVSYYTIRDIKTKKYWKHIS